MDVNELIDAIYDFGGDENEWLEFEKRVWVEVIGYSELDLQRLEQSDAPPIMDGLP